MDYVECFDNYFNKLTLFSRKSYGTLPTVTYSKKLNPLLLISEPDEDGEVEWNPIPQSNNNWDLIEERWGFSLSNDLRGFYGTYYFLTLSGVIDNVYVYFYSNDGSVLLEDFIYKNYQDAQSVFPNSNIFLIGNAVIDGDDGYFIYVENNTGAVFCYEADRMRRVDLRYSLFEIIDGMEAID